MDNLNCTTNIENILNALISAINLANAPNDILIFERKMYKNNLDAQLEFKKSNYTNLAQQMAWLTKL